jgi:hypothetical protein
MNTHLQRVLKPVYTSHQADPELPGSVSTRYRTVVTSVVAQRDAT